MKSLLYFLSVINLVLPTVSSQLLPNILVNQPVVEQKKTLQEEKINAEIVISNNKHRKNGQLITGTKDYKKEFTQAINNIRQQLKLHKVMQFKIDKIYAKLEEDQNSTKLNLSKDSIEELLRGTEVEILSTKVTIKKVSNIQNSKDIPSSVQLYTYDIFYKAVIDGKEIEKNINVYNNEILFSKEYLLNSYQIFFEIIIEKTIPEITEIQLSVDNNIKMKSGTTNFIEIMNYQELVNVQISLLLIFPKDFEKFIEPKIIKNDDKIGFNVGATLNKDAKLGTYMVMIVADNVISEKGVQIHFHY